MPFSFIWVTLIVFLVLVAVAAVIGGSAFLFFRLRSGSPFQLPMRLLLRLYLYIVIVAGLLIFAQGLASLVQSGLAQGIDREFSYRPVYTGSPEPQHPLELKPQDQLTDAEREELIRIREERRQREETLGLEMAFQQGLIQGISFTIIGAIIWGVHIGGRQLLETPDERRGTINRLYLVVLVVIFGIITIINLPQAVVEGFQYYLVPPAGDLRSGDPPGGKLGLSITALPIWIFYLVTAIGTVRRGSEES